MRLTIVSSLLSIIYILEGARATADLLKKRFGIIGPEYEYDSWEFTMDFEVSDFMTDNMIGYTIYDGVNCKDGDTMNSGDNDITNNEGYLLSRFRSDNVPKGDGNGSRAIKIQSEVVPGLMTNSGIYRDGENGEGIVEYCLRFSNYNTDKDDPAAREVNFLETTVKVTVRLEGDFGVSPFVDSNEALVEEEQEGVAVEAYLCDRDDNVVPIAEFNQGQTVRVCVTPTPEVLAKGFRMRQIEDFVYRRELPISTRQRAISPGTGGVAADELTVVSCRPGSVVCAFETMLFADFFVSEGLIAGQGSAFLQIGGDNNGVVPARRLQESKPTNGPVGFAITIQLVPLEEQIQLDETGSSAPTMVTASVLTKSLLFATGLLAFLL